MEKKEQRCARSAREDAGGMFRGEPASWLVTMGVLGVYAALFFGFNAARTAADGHWTMGGLLLMGAMAGTGVAIGVAEEAQRRRKAKKRWREKRMRRESREKRSGSVA